MQPTYEVLHENVYYFPGVIPDIENLMSVLEEVGGLSVTPWEVWYANNDSKENPYGDLKTLSYGSLEYESDETVREKSSYILNTILGSMEECTKIFLLGHEAPQEEIDHLHREIFGSHTYGIRRYSENQGMGLHQDMVVKDRDTITIAVYLDDSYEGGELGVKITDEEEIFIKNKAGSIVVFPSSYLHESKNLISGRKTIITHVHMPINRVLKGMVN